MSDTTTILVLGLAAIFGYKFLVLDKKGGGGAPAPVPDVPAVGVPQPPAAAEGEKPAEGGGGEKPAEGGEKGAKGDKAKKEEYPAAGGEGEAPKEEKKSSSKKKAKYANAYYSAYLNEGSSLYSLNRIGNCL